MWILILRTREIRDQTYDEKGNTVKITVVCCSPEKFRQKLCCKGGKTIKSIEIVEPKPPTPKPAPSKDTLKPAPPPPPTPKPEPPPPARKEPAPVPGYPAFYPIGICLVPCLSHRSSQLLCRVTPRSIQVEYVWYHGVWAMVGRVNAIMGMKSPKNPNHQNLPHLLRRPSLSHKSSQLLCRVTHRSIQVEYVWYHGARAMVGRVSAIMGVEGQLRAMMVAVVVAVEAGGHHHLHVTWVVPVAAVEAGGHHHLHVTWVVPVAAVEAGWHHHLHVTWVVPVAVVEPGFLAAFVIHTFAKKIHRHARSCK
ncbi:hypothetical protein L1049_009837 [Liquidambar formosana]|uniref:Uncharacterized protein n=1 Tax=Liquidambar formosana TaxID=63359 RepID=A0AAP0N8Q4_LIQFO